MQPESEMCMETVGARAGPSTCCPRLTSPDTASVEQYKTRPATGRMTAPERASADCRSGRMAGLRAVEPPTYGSPHRAISARIRGCSSDPICMGCIRMQSGPTRKTDVRIDEARGCRITNIAPWTHTSVSHGVRCMIKQPWQTGWTNVFENGTSDASAGRNADAATDSDVMGMKVAV